MRTFLLFLSAALTTFLAGCGDEPVASSLGQCGNIDTSSLEGTIDADSCFRLSPDAFGFENYSGGANLTAREMIEVFGTGVCSKHLTTCTTDDEQIGYCNESCVLTLQARRHMDIYNRSMANGHCDGLSAMSQLIHAGSLPQFDGSPTHDLSDSAALQHEIARWWATQSTVQQRGVFRDMESSDALAYLDDLWAHHSMATLWIHYVDGEHTAAHALTPYALTSLPDGSRYMYVYDSNDPDILKHLVVHPQQNEWEYEVKPGVWAGSAASPAAYRLLRFVSNEARIGRYCWFCEESFADETQDYMTLGGDAGAKLEDGAGKLIQKVGGDWSSEGGDLHFSLTNLDDKPLPSIMHEVSIPYRIEFTGPTSIDTPAHFIVSSPGGKTMSIEGIHLDAGAVGVATVHPGTNEIDYEASGKEMATVHISAHHDTADYAFLLTIQALAGHKIHLENDEPNEVLVVSLEAPSDMYDVSVGIERHMQDLVEKATFIQPAHASTVEYRIKYGSFVNGVEVDVDLGNDGIIDMVETWMP